VTRVALHLLDLLDELDSAVMACRLWWAGSRRRVLRAGLALLTVALLFVLLS